MLQKILQIIAQEDTFKLFTTNAPNSIYEITSTIRNRDNPLEVQNAILYYFKRVLHEHDPGTFYHAEALRVMKICEDVFMRAQPEALYPGSAPPRAPRDINDEVVDLYLESLNFFSSGLEEPVLAEHIRYLEK